MPKVPKVPQGPGVWVENKKKVPKVPEVPKVLTASPNFQFFSISALQLTTTEHLDSRKFVYWSENFNIDSVDAR